MTAVAEDLDLDRWVTFSRDDDCDGVVGECPMTAVVVAVFDRRCGCGGDRQQFCAACRDLFLWIVEPFMCAFCSAPVTFLRMEPIR